MADSLATIAPIEFPIGLLAEHGHLIAFVQTVLHVFGLLAPRRDLKPSCLAVNPLLALSDPWGVSEGKACYWSSITVMAESRICAESPIEGDGLILNWLWHYALLSLAQ